METSPCKDCICLAICRQKVLSSKGSNLFQKVWTFAYLNNHCSLLQKYIETPRMDLTVHKGTILLHDLQILKTKGEKYESTEV